MRRARSYNGNKFVVKKSRGRGGERVKLLRLPFTLLQWITIRNVNASAELVLELKRSSISSLIPSVQLFLLIPLSLVISTPLYFFFLNYLSVSLKDLIKLIRSSCFSFPPPPHSPHFSDTFKFLNVFDADGNLYWI